MGFRTLSNALLWAANHKVILHVGAACEEMSQMACDAEIVGHATSKNSLQERKRTYLSFFANPFIHRLKENALPLLLKAKAMRYSYVGRWPDAAPVRPRMPLLFPMTNAHRCCHRLWSCVLGGSVVTRVEQHNLILI